MAEYTYTVVGKSNVEPKGLPEGLTVVKDRQLIKGSVGLVYIAEKTSGEHPVYLSVDLSGVVLSREDAIKVRDLLNRVLESTRRMRVVLDGNDAKYHDNYRWFEVETDKFVYASTYETARFRFSERPESCAAYDYIKANYGGIHSVTYQEV